MLTHVLTFLVIKLCFSEICQVLEIKIFFQLGKVDVLSILADLLSRWAPSHPEEIKKFSNKLRQSDETIWKKIIALEVNVKALKMVVEILSYMSSRSFNVKWRGFLYSSSKLAWF